MGRLGKTLPLETAMDMVAERVKTTRDAHWQAEHGRTLGIAHLGGATLDNEENYLIKKLFSSLGMVQIENQAQDLTLFNGPRSGGQLRTRWGHHVPAGFAELRLYCDRGFEYGRKPSRGVFSG